MSNDEKKPYTATDAVSDVIDVVDLVVDVVVVAPVTWLLGNTVGRVLDLT